MTKHITGTRKEWLAARLELLQAEKELTRRSDELAKRRQELPWVRVDKEYRFDTDQGSASLAELFRGRSQLLVYHFMFGPDFKAGCPSCSAIADGFAGFVVHLANSATTSTGSAEPVVGVAGANPVVAPCRGCESARWRLASRRTLWPAAGRARGGRGWRSGQSWRGHSSAALETALHLIATDPVLRPAMRQRKADPASTPTR